MKAGPSNPARLFVCRLCGRHFTPKCGNNAKWCPECRPAAYRELQREAHRRACRKRLAETSKLRLGEAYACAGIARNGGSLESIHAAELRSARTRPGWCSAARWRIELRRRVDAAYYRDCGADERRLA